MCGACVPKFLCFYLNLILLCVCAGVFASDAALGAHGRGLSFAAPTGDLEV